MAKIIEADRAIVKAITFRGTDLHCGPEQQVEDAAAYVAAYREANTKKGIEDAIDVLMNEVAALTKLVDEQNSIVNEHTLAGLSIETGVLAFYQSRSERLYALKHAIMSIRRLIE